MTITLPDIAEIWKFIIGNEYTGSLFFLFVYATGAGVALRIAEFLFPNDDHEDATIPYVIFWFVSIPGTILLAIKFFRGGQTTGDQAEEAKMIQEIYKNLSRMEERVEALETILLDHEKQKGRQAKP